MIEQIQKFSKGGGTSRQQLNASKGRFEAAYETASDEARQKASALIQSASNYTSANPTVGRNNRLNQAQVYDEATRILRGEGQSQAPSIDNGWGNKVINDFYAINKNRAQKTTPSQSAGQFTKYGSYDSNYFGLTDDSWDLNARVNALAENIMTSLDNAKASIDSGIRIPGWSLEKIKNLQTYLGNAITNHANDPRGLQAAILRKAKDFGITDKASWDEYFGETDDLSVAEQNKAKLAGWTFADNHSNALLNQYLSNNQYRIGTDKEGTQYILDKNYNIVTGKNDTGIEANYYNAGYGSGYAIGQDGRFYVGDNMFSMDQNSPYYTQIKGYVDRIKQQNKDAYVYSKSAFDMNTTLSNHDILNKHAAKFHGKKILDLSRQFGGKQVIATIDNNDFTTAIDPNTGAIDLRNPGLKLYTVNGEELLEGDYNSLRQHIGDLNLSGEGVASQNITAWNDPQVNLDGLALPDMTTDLRGGEGWWGWGNAQRNNNGWETGDAADMDIKGQRDMAKQVDAAAKYLVYLWGNKNNGKLNNVQNRDMARWFADDNTSLQAIAIITKALRENPNLFNEASNSEATRKYKETWQAMLRAYKHKIASYQPASEVTVQKDGGILYAKEGQTLDIAGNVVNTPDMGESYAASVRRKSNELAADENKVREEAAKYGRTAKQQRVGERWTPQDTLRATALATDIAGLIAAATGVATGGMGNLIAVGAGAASTIQDTIADFTDDSVSAGQAWKNLGLNVGFTAAAAVGGNAPRIVKSALKVVPKVMMYAGAAGIMFDKEVHNTVSKLTSGEKLDMHDWRNIMNVLKVGTGMATAGVSNAKAKKGASAADDMYKAHKKKLLEDSTINENVKYVGVEGGSKAIAVDKTIYENVNTKLNTGKQEDFDEALAILTRAKDDPDSPGAGLSSDDAAKLIESVAGKKNGIKEKLQFWKDAPESKRLRDASVEQIENLTGADVSAEARLLTIAQLRQMNNYDPNSRLSRWSEKFNPAMSAVVGGAGYSNTNEAITELNKKIGPISPTKAQGALDNLSDDAMRALRDKQKAAYAEVRDAQRGAYDDARAKADAAREAVKTARPEGDDAAIAKQLEQLDADIQRNTEAQAALKRDILDDVPTARDKKAKQALEDYRLLISKQKELADKIAAIQSRKKSRWSGAKNAHIIDNDGKIKPVGNSKNKEHNQLFNLQQEIQTLESKIAKSKHAQAAKGYVEAEAKYAQLQDERARLQQFEDYRSKQSALATAEDDVKSTAKELRKQLSDKRHQVYAEEASWTTNTTKDATVNIGGSDVKVASGSSVKSYAYLRDAKTAERVAKSQNPNMKDIPRDQFEKLFPSNISTKIRGAAVDPTTGQVVFWEKGGQIQSKFSHLRK